ncbi:rhomboid-domain-containing protein [Fomitiporia mediterranea MF3/22]|uniref:rhomboid-domain-containing protein n=1 Tax=Fomitiporia mediterranea (strain MF3/22) TaxID=694068 RepID=UPI0004407A46|nr:rhomboid-domain-containing protein [Fomitiporia mediterranea MF3/22]EJD01069.1 rhomboid-domain-containing protein [Fomitiporia mediterranea MF3/22]
MNVLRAWSLSSSCRSLPLRSVTRQLDAKFFSTSVKINSSQSFTAVWQKPCNASTTQSLFSQTSPLSRHILALRESFRPRTGLGWYRDSFSRGTPVKRGVSGRNSQSPYPQQFGPYDRFRRWFDQFPSEFIVWGIIGINGVVFLAWQYAIDRAKNGDPSLLIIMSRNVQNSWRNIREGRLWSIIGSTFSHNNAGHILLNCMSFYFMAPPIVNLIGNTSFMTLYFFGGISCSMLSLLLNKTVSKRDGTSHGASGAIFAVVSFFACVSPKTTFLIFGVIPAPAWAVVGGFFIWDGLSALSDRRTIFDGAGHVGGILAGVVYYLAKRRLLFFLK